MRIIIKNGGARCIYSDAAKPFMDALGKTSIKRASHVEPDENGKWWADMSPVLGPVLGPYELRQAALDAEVRWLEKNHLANH